MLDSDFSKEQHLRKHGAWNAAAEAVAADLFTESEFFDPRDLILVKYEMLRCVERENMSVVEAAGRFGFSRAGFYKVRTAYEQAGMVGLISARPGPRQAHKLTTDILAFIDEQLVTQKRLTSAQLALLVLQHHKLSVHPRSIERALARREKKGGLAQ